MQTERPTPQALDAPESAGSGRQYHPTTLAVKHGLSRADARKVIAAAGASRARAHEIAVTMAGKRTASQVDEATHGSGIRNADHGTGSDKQKLPDGGQRRPVPKEDAFRLPAVDENRRGIRKP